MNALELIKKHEGLRLKPYQCPAGKLTIGYGTNIEDGITEQEAELLLMSRVVQVRHELNQVFLLGERTAMGKARYEALTDMVYNLGLPVFLGFKKTIKALREGNWDKAAAEMINSRWAMQVGRRATTLAQIIKTGEAA